MNNNDNPNKSENNGRNPDGTFAVGNHASPGRPKRKTITELIHEKLDKGDGDLNWEQLVTIFLSMAKRKDKDILKELWHYTDGMPTQRNELTGKDGEALIPKPITDLPINVPEHDSDTKTV